MLSIIGYMLAVYAIARLLQVPIEAWEPQTPAQVKSRSAVLTLVSLVGILAMLALVMWLDEKSSTVGPLLK